MKDIEITYTEVVDQLKERSNPSFAESRGRIIGRDSRSYGVSISEIRRITKKYSDIDINLVEKFLSSEVLDIQMAGVFLASSLREPLGVGLCQKLVENYINDWSVCDTFATEVVAPQLKEDSQVLESLNTMAHSDNKWARRLALVSAIKSEDSKYILASLLPNYKDEKDPIVKKAVLWAAKT